MIVRRLLKPSLMAAIIFALTPTSYAELVAYYPLNELNGTSVGTTVFDMSPNARNMVTDSDADPKIGPVQGIPSANAALYGTAYNFNLPAENLNFTDTVTNSFDGSGLTQNSELTYAAWIKPAASQISRPTILGSNGRGYDFRIAPSEFGWSLVLSAGNDYDDLESAISTATIETGVWTHVAVTKGANGSAGDNLSSVDFYINGVLVESGTIAQTSITGSPIRFFLGVASQTDQYFSGGIDEVRIYNTVLDASEIAGLAIVPEPGSIIMIAIGYICLVGPRLRKRS